MFEGFYFDAGTEGFNNFKMNELIKEDSILNIQSIERNIDNLVGAYLLYINRHSLNKETFQKLFERLPKKFASSKHFDDVRK